MKLLKNKSVTIRIAGAVKEEISKRGLSVQKIIDQWIDNNLVPYVEMKSKKKTNK